MTSELRITRGRGGNRHPIAVKQFILDRLAQVGEDYISGLHQAYKEALDKLSVERAYKDIRDNLPKKRRRVHYYYKPVYASFSKKVWELIIEGKVEFSGREEASDDRRFIGWKYKPARKFVQLVR